MTIPLPVKLVLKLHDSSIGMALLETVWTNFKYEAALSKRV